MPSKAIRLFEEIKDPSRVNIILLFNACAQLGTPEALSMAQGCLVEDVPILSLEFSAFDIATRGIDAMR